jgi:hypothetical protein
MPYDTKKTNICYILLIITIVKFLIKKIEIFILSGILIIFHKEGVRSK